MGEGFGAKGLGASRGAARGADDIPVARDCAAAAALPPRPRPPSFLDAVIRPPLLPRPAVGFSFSAGAPPLSVARAEAAGLRPGVPLEVDSLISRFGSLNDDGAAARFGLPFSLTSSGPSVLAPRLSAAISDPFGALAGGFLAFLVVLLLRIDL